MSMSHKAYAFDWLCFDVELAPLLRCALSTNDRAPLVEFIHRERLNLTDPYEGQPLSIDWESTLEKGDVQELGDLAITRYYNVVEDYGLGDSWIALSDALPGEDANALLGTPFCEGERYFDPGYQGAYFQSPTMVRQFYSILRSNMLSELASYVALLAHCASKDIGVYVTF
ncbi:MAG: hypothetical protein JWN70_7175 [Planctomycetaceae bacterium]|nr:hypothetical protein [Planctomycetaceae bacterium]